THAFASDTGLTGDIIGDCSQLFAQSKYGVHASIDGGVSWADLGIGTIPETRFFFVNNTVYAPEDKILWKKVVDPPTFIAPILLSRDTFNFAPRGCATADSILTISASDACSPTKLVSANLTGAPTFHVTIPILPA